MRRAAMVLVILASVSACSGDDAADETSAPTAPPTAPPVDTNDGLSPREQEAMERIEAYFAAVNEGRVDDLEAILGIAFSEPLRNQYIFHGNMMADGKGWVRESCEIVAATDEQILVECRAINTDPVFVAEGASEIIAPFVLKGGVLEELAWVPRGRSFQAPINSYMEYLRVFHSEDHSVCDPFAQTDEILSHFGLAKSPECGALLGPIRGDIAAWVEAGKSGE